MTRIITIALAAVLVLLVSYAVTAIRVHARLEGDA